VVASAGCDLIDIKNVAEGSLGAQPPWVIKRIVSELSGTGATFSVALGDLPNKPGTAGLAAYGAAQLGVGYIKAGLYGATNYDEALAVMSAVVRSIRLVSGDILAVASGYADYKRFGGVSCDELVAASAKAGADVVMVDTAIKDGMNLFDALTLEEIKDFIDAGHDAGMKVALAGSIGLDHVDALCELAPDIIGVRGAVCDGLNRKNRIIGEKVARLYSYVRSHAVPDKAFAVCGGAGLPLNPVI